MRKTAGWCCPAAERHPLSPFYVLPTMPVNGERVSFLLEATQHRLILWPDAYPPCSMPSSLQPPYRSITGRRCRHWLRGGSSPAFEPAGQLALLAVEARSETAASPATPGSPGAARRRPTRPRCPLPQLEARFCRLDLLNNNAGVSSRKVSVDELGRGMARGGGHQPHRQLPLRTRRFALMKRQQRRAGPHRQQRLHLGPCPGPSAPPHRHQARHHRPDAQPRA